MSATNVQANWTTVTFPTTGATLTQIDDVSIDLGGSIEKYSGDLSRFNTLAVAMMTEPKVDVTSTNPYQFMSIAPGTSGTLTATHADAKLASGGGIVYTLSNAIFVTAKSNGPHAKFGTVTASFECVSADGTTNPLAITRV